MPASGSISAAESGQTQSDKERQGARAGGSGVYKPLWQTVASKECYRVVVFGGREGVSCMRQHGKNAARNFCQTGEKHYENQKLYVEKKVV